MHNIYDEAVKKMKPEEIDHHCSDLYLKVTPVSAELVKDYDYKENVTTVTDQIDHVPWYEIPFAYTGKNWRCK